MMTECVGYLDGTKIQMSRPGGSNSNHRSIYSGHKKFHCFIYMTITTADELVFFANVPIEGRRNDNFALRDTGLENALQENLNIDGVQYYVYGDAIFHICHIYRLVTKERRQVHFNLCSPEV